MKAYKKIKVVAALSVFVLIGVAAVKQPTTKSDKFKNLQVLPKDITEDSLHKIMDGFNEGLGVNCNYCHVQDKITYRIDFAKDDKSEKEIGRLMMRMTSDINKKYFHFNESVIVDSMIMLKPVTCFTCHRGVPMPVTEPGAKN